MDFQVYHDIIHFIFPISKGELFTHHRGYTVPAAFGQDMSSGPRIHVRQLITSESLAPEDLNILLASKDTSDTYTPNHTERHTHSCLN